MKLPKTINVCGVDYQIYEVKEIEHDPGNYGVCVYATSHIEIKKHLSDDRKLQTLAHELLHAIFFESGYKEDSEEMIERVSTVMYQVLKENDLAKMLD